MTTAANIPDGVKLEDLLRLYEREQRYKENKKAFYASDEGKEYNRQKAKLFYQRHKEEILAKRKTRYETDSETLLNRAKAYYALHSDEINEKNKQKRLLKKEPITD